VLAGGILGTVNAFILQRSEERFGHRIIVADPSTAGGLPEIMLLQRPDELLRCVVAAAIGVKIPFSARPRLRAAISMAFSMSGVL
jgi:hypothetical protein